MFRSRANALFYAGLLAAGLAGSAHASTVTYDITLTQTGGTLITAPPADFTVTSSFTIPSPTTSYETETISGLSFTIAGKTYTSNASIQFSGLGPAINNFYGFSDTASGDTLSIGGGNSFNLYGTGIPSTDVGTVAFAVAATPLPAALPLFAGGVGALGLFGWRKKRKGA
jgi:hypothetical protein